MGEDDAAAEPWLLTERAVAAALSISPRAVRYLRAQGRLPSLKIGGSRRYPASAVRAFVESLAEPGDVS